MDKKDEKLRMCIDHYTLNTIIIKNNYPLHQINDLFDHLNGASYFNHIHLKLSYYHIHVKDENVEKMVMTTKYNSYDFLVMLFALCNASTTFTTLMNLIFHEKLDEFVVIYIDDILVYSKYATHLEFVLQKLKENKLHANRAKNKFTNPKMNFLGHVLFREGVRPNPKKIESIRECQSLVLAKKVKSLLGLAKFYMKS
jgi:hypothetical protein